jgi:hypothetical protein
MKYNKIIIISITCFAILSLSYYAYHLYKKDKNQFFEHYQSISQPTITNPNPIMNGYSTTNTTYNEYAQPYKQPRFASSTPESFRYRQQSQPAPAELSEGHYTITSVNGDVPLNSIAFTPVQCNTILFNSKLQPSNQQGWNLTHVSKGIYIFKKPSGKECLYASIGNTLKSYLLSDGCNQTNVCGLEDLDYKKELDPYSKRTYFEVWQYPEGYAIKNVETQQFICLQEGKISFSSIVTPNCLFKFSQ